jgi:DNA-binding transcriptional regulator YiaG
MAPLMDGSVNTSSTHTAPASPGETRGPGEHRRPVIARPRAHRPGTVAGTVLNCARRSAALSTAGLARISGINGRTLRAWDDGRSPLSSATLPLLNSLTTALVQSGADEPLVADLETAAWCDLVIQAVRSEDDDVTCLVADPAAREEPFRELVIWSVIGHVPARYRPYAQPGRLLPDLALAGLVMETLAALHPEAVETRWLHY